MDTMNKQPLVSVRLMTYNHAAFIRDAMEGIMKQEISFPVEVVVGDDFSTDGTLDIIREYKDTANIKIKILERKVGDEYWGKRQEKGRLYNFINILENCKGKYIALLDGDDYWTDPKKIQKQVDFLKTNEDCVLCHHWHKLAVERNSRYQEVEAPKEGHGYYPQEKSDVSKVFCNKLRVKTRTILFRNVINPGDLLTAFPNAAFGDVPLSFLLGKKGKFGFIDEEMAVYRVTGKGVSTEGLNKLGVRRFKIEHLKNWIRIWDQADKLYDYRYKSLSLGSVRFFFSLMPITVNDVVGIIAFNQINRDYPFIDKTINSFWLVNNFGVKALKRKAVRLFK